MPPFAPSEPALALVTGAARGIGAAVARAFAATGAPVALLDRDEAVHEVAAELGALAVTADVADAEAVEAAVAHVEREAGPIGALANVAGVLRGGPVLDLDDADWHTCLAVNATGVWNTGRAVGRRMHRRGTGSNVTGSIVTVASNAAAVPRTGMAAYAASKAAAVALTRCLGLELAPHVRCNVVCPGSTDTPMLQASLPAGAGTEAVVEGVAEQFRVGIPLGRIAAPADVAASVLFLSGPAARHITLQSLTVDGGAALGA